MNAHYKYNNDPRFKDIRPCPFCGEKVRVVNGLVWGTLTFVCSKCGADVMFYDNEHNVKGCIEAWNRRAESE